MVTLTTTTKIKHRITATLTTETVSLMKSTEDMQFLTTDTMRPTTHPTTPPDLDKNRATKATTTLTLKDTTTTMS